jgi:hypothetical protein
MITYKKLDQAITKRKREINFRSTNPIILTHDITKGQETLINPLATEVT